MRIRHSSPLIGVCLLQLMLVFALMTPLAQHAMTAAVRLPGLLGDGVMLLSNGWRIAPAGRAIAVGDLPLAMVASPDSRYLVITNNGWSKPTLTIVDTAQMYVRSRVPVDHAWLGLAWSPNGRQLYSSGAADNTINVFDYQNAALRLSKQLVVDRSSVRIPANLRDLGGTGFIGGISVSPDGKTVYAAHVLGRAVSAIDVVTGDVQTLPLPAETYATLLSPDGHTLFVSLWGGAKVIALDARTLTQSGEVAVGEHPNAMALSRDGTRLFVACANTNRVWAIDVRGLATREQISVSLFPNAPPGSTPNALDLSPDGRTLAVANADNNTVALVDVSMPGASVVQGFLPTGWYPTGVLFDRDGHRLFVLNGKGSASQPNPRGPQPVSPPADGEYVGQLLQGTLSVVPVPDAPTLAMYTRRAEALSAYRDETRLAPANAPVANPIPRRVGGPSPIKHIFYVIRENRTYDQILGDLERGNGDPSLALFDEPVTPNAHALAREFVTLDNFYVDAEVSYDGHAFSTGAYATDAVEKLWPTDYAHRGGAYLSEGGYGDRNPFGNLDAPAHGYLWDVARRHGVTVRSYGEFAMRDGRNGPIVPTVPGLTGLVSPSYPPFDLAIPDNVRVDAWLKEFRTFEGNGQLPQLNIIRLGDDHTEGTKQGARTPRAMVADNDAALGRVVEAISHSRYWNDSAIFVLEDDAQNGPDHVDAHRSPAFVISPFVQRGRVDSTLYTTSGVLRTMELILGLPPMSQYDAAATPMYAAFRPQPIVTPYTARPATIDLNEVNGGNAYGAAMSARMNFAEADRAPEYELNVIIWKSIRGAASPMPPPVRGGFVRRADRPDPDDSRDGD